jgi:hypothetical protein
MPYRATRQSESPAGRKVLRIIAQPESEQSHNYLFFMIIYSNLQSFADSTC